MSKTDSELIDLYLTNKLSPAESELFNERKLDPEFEKKASLMGEVATGIKMLALEEMKESLRKEERKIYKAKNFLWKWIILVAALVLFLLALWWFNRPTESQADFYAQHLKPFKNNLVLDERSDPTVSRALEVFQNYENGDYENALKGIDELLLVDNNPNYRFYKANTLIALNRTEGAIAILENLLLENKSRFQIEAKWFLALCYAKMGRFSEAKPLFEELSSYTFYKEKVNQILKDSRFQ